MGARHEHFTVRLLAFAVTTFTFKLPFATVLPFHVGKEVRPITAFTSSFATSAFALAFGKAFRLLAVGGNVAVLVAVEALGALSFTLVDCIYLLIVIISFASPDPVCAPTPVIRVKVSVVIDLT